LDDIYRVSYFFGWGFFTLFPFRHQSVKAAPPNWTRQRDAQNAEVGRRNWKEGFAGMEKE
jgi:hypothetical protein